MKKKFAGTILALSLMTFTLTACGDDKNNPPTTTTTTTAESTTAETTTSEETTPEESSTEETTTANSSASTFTTGTWDGNVFTNTWLNLKFTFPEGITIATEEEIKQITAAGADVLSDNGNYTDAQLKASEITTVYDYFVTLPDNSNIQLGYENIALTAPGMDITPEDYLDIIKTQAESIADFNYKFGETETVELGGQTFVKLPGTLMDGALNQDYYCIKLDNYMAFMGVTYASDNATAMQEVINGITSAQ